MGNYFYSIVNVFSKVANTSLLFLIIINVVSKELFGLFSYYQALTLMLLVFIDYGFNLYMAKELTLNPRQNQKLITQVIVIKLIASAGILTFVGLGSMLKVIYSPSLLFLVLLIGIINSLIATYGVIFRNYGQFRSEALISFFITIISIGFLFILGNFISDLSILLLSFTIIKVFHLFVMIKSLKKTMKTSHFDLKLFEHRQAKILIERNFSYALHLTIGTLYFQIDTLVLKQLDSLDAVAEYTAAFKFIGMILIGTEVIVNVLIPKLVRLKEIESISYLNRIKRIKKIIFYCTITLISVFLIFSTFLTNIIFPKEFESTNNLLIILSFMVFFRFISTVPGIVITIENLQKYRTNIAILGLTINTILSIILVPFLSYYGAAISSLVSAALIWIAYEIILKRKGF